MTAVHRPLVREYLRCIKPNLNSPEITAAKAELKSANSNARDLTRRVRALRGTVLRCRIRKIAARFGIQTWIAALLAGSLSSLALAILLTLSGLSLLVIIASAAFASGIAVLVSYAILAQAAGENAGNVYEIRSLVLQNTKMQFRRELAAQSAALARREVAHDTLKALIAQAAGPIHRLLSIDPGRLYPDEFEHYVASIFQHLGYGVQVIGKTGDQGVDVVATKGDCRLAIQVKRYQGPVGNEAVQQVFAGMYHHRCQKCIVVCCSGFTHAAVSLAQSTGCTLVGRNELAPLICGQLGF